MSSINESNSGDEEKKEQSSPAKPKAKAKPKPKKKPVKKTKYAPRKEALKPDEKNRINNIDITPAPAPYFESEKIIIITQETKTAKQEGEKESLKEATQRKRAEEIRDPVRASMITLRCK